MSIVCNRQTASKPEVVFVFRHFHLLLLVKIKKATRKFTFRHFLGGGKLHDCLLFRTGKPERFIMAAEVYSPTVVSNPNTACCLVPSECLGKARFIIKLLEVLLSLVAFILEEMVSLCVNCAALEFFEFVSCTAFLFTILLIVLLYTSLHDRVGIACCPSLDFVYTMVIAFFFLIASIVFAAINIGTTLEKSAVVFGFLATFAFMADLFLFWRKDGFPFLKGETEQFPNEEPDEKAPAETVKLNLDAAANE